MSKRLWSDARLTLSVLVGLCLLSLGPSLASAGAVGVALLVDDYAEQPLNLHLLGPVQNSSVQVTQEGIGVLGGADAHFEYLSNDPNAPAPGQTLTFNFNIYEDPNLTQLSDTWNLVITGHTPTGLDNSNVSIDSHFRSDSLDEIPPPALVNAVAVSENFFLGAPSGLPDGTYQYVGPLLADLTTGFNSAPEPSSCILLGVGGLACGAWFIRRRAK